VSEPTGEDSEEPGPGVQERSPAPETVGLGLGRRIHVIGNSCSGKSTMARFLGEQLEIPVVELDALNWLPGWVGLNATNPDELERLMREATKGEEWVVAGSYSAFCRRVFWDRLETMVWLDLPMMQLLARVLRRSWRRWRSKEILWGTNEESFWRQLMVWRKEDSLVWWIVTQHSRKRREMVAMQSDPRWAHLRFVRLGSSGEVRRFVAEIEARQRRVPHREDGAGDSSRSIVRRAAAVPGEDGMEGNRKAHE